MRPLVTVLGFAVLASISTPALAHPPADHDRTLGVERTTRLRERVQRKLDRVRQRIQALAARGAIGPAEVERHRELEARVLEITGRILADGRVTADERRELRRVRRHGRHLARELRARVGRDAWRATRPPGN